MPRITLLFTLSSAQIQADLLHEFSLHQGVQAEAVVIDGAVGVRVESGDAASAVWDVRATVGMFDDGAVEIVGQE